MNIEAPEHDAARDAAAVHLASVVDPSPALPTNGAAHVDDENDSPARAEDEIELVDVDASSLYPAAFLLVTLATELAAKRFGDKWRCDEQRAHRIARPLVRLAHRYMPSLETYGPWAELGIAVTDYVVAAVHTEIIDAATPASSSSDGVAIRDRTD